MQQKAFSTKMFAEKAVMQPFPVRRVSNDRVACMFEMAAHLMAPSLVRCDANQRVSCRWKSVERYREFRGGKARDTGVSFLATSVVKRHPVVIESSKRMID